MLTEDEQPLPLALSHTIDQSPPFLQQKYNVQNKGEI